MNTVQENAIPSAIGTLFQGGRFAGRFKIGNEEYALIVAPKSEGETTGAWGEFGADINAARSCNDGHANTLAMAAAGSVIAKWALNLSVGGHADWYLPSRDELEILYRNLKPSKEENYCSFRDGDNASCIPAGYLYTPQDPRQSPCAEFHAGQPEAFDDAWYWASTQYSPLFAWLQYFDDGFQYNLHKGSEGRARAVRRFRVTN